MPARVVILPRPEFSDGSREYWPTGDSKGKLVEEPLIYLEKIATMWMKEIGQDEPDVIYRFESLPEGYAVYEQQRITNPKHVDKRLFGFSKKYFDSPNRYFPHFAHVMKNKGSSADCPCTVCSTGKKQGPGKLGGPSVTVSKPPRTPGARKSNAKAATSRVPDVDVYTGLFDRLSKEKKLDVEINDRASMDYRTTKADLAAMREKIQKQPSWIPRIGEVVLFYVDSKEDDHVNAGPITVDEPARPDAPHERRWEAGTVAQVPTIDLEIQDLVEAVPRDKGLTFTGFRIEHLPDPSEKDGQAAKIWRYVPLHRIRPMAFWKEIYPPNDLMWPNTLFNALTAASSFSLLDKHRMKGEWPQAMILSRGIYLGSELIMIGDVIRLYPPRTRAATLTCHPDDFPLLKITDIELHFDSIEDYKKGDVSCSTVAFTGFAFTSRKIFCLASNPVRVKEEDLGTGVSDYLKSGIPLYYIHTPGQKVRVPFQRVIGRTFEYMALTHWFPTIAQEAEDLGALPHPAVLAGRYGVHVSRKFSQEELKARIGLSYGLSKESTEGRSKWFWAETRIEQLDLLSLNNVDVGKNAPPRDANAWRNAIASILIAEEEEAEEAREQEPADQSRKESRPDGREVSPDSSQRVHNQNGAVPTLEEPFNLTSSEQKSTGGTGQDDGSKDASSDYNADSSSTMLKRPLSISPQTALQQQALEIQKKRKTGPEFDVEMVG